MVKNNRTSKETFLNIFIAAGYAKEQKTYNTTNYEQTSTVVTKKKKKHKIENTKRKTNSRYTEKARKYVKRQHTISQTTDEREACAARQLFLGWRPY